MRRTLNDTASLLGVMLEADLERGNAADLGAVWRANAPALARAAGALRVYVTDARGIVVFDANNGRDVGRDYTVQPEMRAYFNFNRDEGQDNAAVVAGELRVTAPIRRGGTLVGFVGVARPYSSVVAAIYNARLTLTIGSLSVAAVMVAAGWWIASKLTHSVERLKDYAVAVRDGLPATPPASRADEVAALARAFEEMREALEGKAYVERYTQALAHEFKAPLSSIRGAAELLAENPPEADRARFIGNLRAESARLQQIVDRLLELAALESRRTGGSMDSIDLAGVLREVHAASHATATARRVTLTITAQATPRVRGEKFLLMQAIGNLVQNAVEFTPAGGAVALAIMVDGTQAVITVDDTGPGIPDYALEKIFDRFYSLPRPDTGRKSSGLGLSIVHEIARLHGGDVSLTNRPEGGARARLALPAS
jgi:two-component system sensor histidine kinase CreC